MEKRSAPDTDVDLADLVPAQIAGMDAITLQPAAGAQGEYTGLLLAQAYHRERGEERHEVIIPDTAHGTNPASAGMLGFDLIEIPSKDGRVDLKALEAAAGPKTLALMLTNPNTLGIFEEHVLDIAQIVHDAGGLLYYDGANFNAILGRTSPGNMNFDIVHFNLHKTFTTPHGGGGPGAGPVGVKKPLEPFLPVPGIGLNGRGYHLNYDRPKSIGKVRAWYGDFALLVRAYAYILRIDGDGDEGDARRLRGGPQENREGGSRNVALRASQHGRRARRRSPSGSRTDPQLADVEVPEDPVIVRARPDGGCRGGCTPSRAFAASCGGRGPSHSDVRSRNRPNGCGRRRSDPRGRPPDLRP